MLEDLVRESIDAADGGERAAQWVTGALIQLREFGLIKCDGFELNEAVRDAWEDLHAQYRPSTSAMLATLDAVAGDASGTTARTREAIAAFLVELRDRREVFVGALDPRKKPR